MVGLTYSSWAQPGGGSLLPAPPFPSPRGEEATLWWAFNAVGLKRYFIPSKAISVLQHTHPTQGRKDGVSLRSVGCAPQKREGVKLDTHFTQKWWSLLLRIPAA